MVFVHLMNDVSHYYCASAIYDSCGCRSIVISTKKEQFPIRPIFARHISHRFDCHNQKNEITSNEIHWTLNGRLCNIFCSHSTSQTRNKFTQNQVMKALIFCSWMPWQAERYDSIYAKTVFKFQTCLTCSHFVAIFLFQSNMNGTCTTESHKIPLPLLSVHGYTLAFH